MAYGRSQRDDVLQSNVSEVITRIEGCISYTDFFEKFMVNNVPCIFSEDNTKCWMSRKYWVKGQKPNFEYLREKFGNTIAPVANCNENYYGSQKKTDMPISEFLCYWQDFISRNYPSDMPILYLKDWHLRRDYPSSNCYEVPPYFISDWLNEYWNQRDDVCDDYRFVYMGPKGSWTPEHEDVFSSYSWSANIVGRKRWVLYPPQNKVLPIELEGSSGEPNEANPECRLAVEVIQETGEIIFVPSGWRHEVWNLEDTISINHNWANACNVELFVWPSLRAALCDVEAELQDCLEEGMASWEEQCQVLLHATHGIDFMEFYLFLRTVGEPRISFLISLLRNFDSASSVSLESHSGAEENIGISQSTIEKNHQSVRNRMENLEENPMNTLSLKQCDGISDSVVELERKKSTLELELDGKIHPAILLPGCTNSVHDMPYSEDGWNLGAFHALYDLWCVYRVLKCLLSHHAIRKLEFFKKMMVSLPHVQFMRHLELLIQSAEDSGDLKELKRFMRTLA